MVWVFAITRGSYRLRNQLRNEPPVAETGDAETSKPAISPAASTPGGKRKKPAPYRPTLALRNDSDDHEPKPSHPLLILPAPGCF